MRLTALAARLRSEDTKTPPAEPASVSVTPSESGRPAPPGKRSVLPADQPLAVSRTHWVPSHTSRCMSAVAVVDGPEHARGRGAGALVVEAADVAPRTPAWSTVVTDALPGHGCGTSGGGHALAAPLVTAAVVTKAPVPSGQRP